VEEGQGRREEGAVRSASGTSREPPPAAGLGKDHRRGAASRPKRAGGFKKCRRLAACGGDNAGPIGLWESLAGRRKWWLRGPAAGRVIRATEGLPQHRTPGPRVDLGYPGLGSSGAGRAILRRDRHVETGSAYDPETGATRVRPATELQPVSCGPSGHAARNARAAALLLWSPRCLANRATKWAAGCKPPSQKESPPSLGPDRLCPVN